MAQRDRERRGATDPAAAPSRASFGQRLQRLREARGWTQRQLAEQIGLDSTTVSSWEAGRHCPPLDPLVRLAQILGATTDFLLTGECPAQSIEDARLAGLARELAARGDQFASAAVQLLETLVRAPDLDQAREALDRALATALPASSGTP
ncbi:MAG: helix-turn-helix domain-containing protein [Acidobacteriota bacterium]|nr:helix-turn-helix domain-containing protein [Acidobacteriota bacterium]